MLDSIYHEKKINLKLHFWLEMFRVCHYVRSVVMDLVT